MSPPNQRLYEVWMLDRRPPILEAHFRSYDDAADYVRRRWGRGGYDIRSPDGSWSSKRQTAPDGRAARDAIIDRLGREGGDDTVEPSSV